MAGFNLENKIKIFAMFSFRSLYSQLMSWKVDFWSVLNKILKKENAVFVSLVKKEEIFVNLELSEKANTKLNKSCIYIYIYIYIYI